MELQREQRQRNRPKMKLGLGLGLGLKRLLFSARYLCIKVSPSGSLSTRRGQKRVKRTTSKFCNFWPNRQYPPPPPPLEKIRLLASRQIFIEKLPNESVCSKTSSETHFGTPKGPETKK